MSTPYQGLLENVQEASQRLVGHSNCGLMMMTEAGDLGKIRGMWLNESGIANIVPLKII